MNKEYARYLEEGLYEEYKSLFEEGDFHIPGMLVFKLTMLEDPKGEEIALVQAIEDPKIGSDPVLEERHINAICSLVENGSIDVDSTSELVDVYKVHDLNARSLYLAIWSYATLPWLLR